MNPDRWYHEGVDYALNAGLMVGVSETLFRPDGVLTRGQLVTILYRLAGEPEVADFENPFTDIGTDFYYTKAVLWAAHYVIVEGVSETEFAPHHVATREQMATFLYRYADYTGLRTEAEADLSQFADADSISRWAREAMTWAVGTGLLQRVSDTRLSPRGTALRAQFATVMMRFSNGSR